MINDSTFSYLVSYNGKTGWLPWWLSEKFNCIGTKLPQLFCTIQIIQVPFKIYNHNIGSLSWKETPGWCDRSSISWLYYFSWYNIFIQEEEIGLPCWWERTMQVIPSRTVRFRNLTVKNYDLNLRVKDYQYF